MNGDINPVYRKKAEFFKNGRFRINLTPFELSNMILVPGHRFIPFLRPVVRPWNITLETSDKKKLQKKIIKTHPEKLKSYFSLYGEENFLFMLIDDREENSSLILNTPGSTPDELKMTVFDISPLFKNEEISPGTRVPLMLEIIDWLEGIYIIKKIDTEDTDDQFAGVWTEKLEKGFKTAFIKDKSGKNITDIMSDAFLSAGPDSITNPPLSLEEFFDVSDIYDVADLMAQSRENPEIFEKKKFIKSKTIKVIKMLTSWLKDNADEEDEQLTESIIILEKQVIVTKKTLLAMLEELNNPFITDETINSMLQVISETEQFISSLS